MLVEHQVTVDRPATEVGKVLVSSASQFEGLGTVAYRKGEEIFSKVRGPGPLAKEVVVALGRPHVKPSGVAIPITWRATGAASLFPRLEGELDVVAIEPARSVIRLQGSYQPPFGWMGDLIDRLLLARVARETVADWVDRIGDAIDDTAPHQSAG